MRPETFDQLAENGYFAPVGNWRSGIDIPMVLAALDLVSEPRRTITESEYLAWADRKVREYAGVLNDCCAAILPDGMRFEWTAAEDVPGS